MPRARKESSTFFGYRSRQRILVALAHRGPMRLQEVLEAADCHWDPVLTLVKSGVIVMYGNNRERMLALNPRAPAFKEFRALLRAIEPSPQGKPRLKRIRSNPEFPEVDVKSYRDLCGGWFLSATVLTLAANSGKMHIDDLRRVLRFQRATSVQTARVFTDLEKRQILTLGNDEITINPYFPAAPELVAYAKALMKSLPQYDLRGDAKKWENPAVGTAPHGRVDWTKDVGQAERPRGVSPAADGTPLLFGTVSRFRALTTVAVNGSMRPADLVAATKMNQWTYQRLMDDGWLGKSQSSLGRTNRGTVDISSSLPARDEYIALLRKLAERWPARRVQQTAAGGDAKPRAKFKIRKCFGSVPRTETLMTLAALGTADIATIERAVSSTDRQAIRRTILMLQHFGIARYVEREGNSKMIELDPDWFAAVELRSLLDALIPIDGRYAGRARSALAQMSDFRRKMGENARKARANVEIKKAPRLYVSCRQNADMDYGRHTGPIESLGIAEKPGGRAIRHWPISEVLTAIKEARYEFIVVAPDEPLNKSRWSSLRIWGKKVKTASRGAGTPTLTDAPKCSSRTLGRRSRH